VADDIVTRLREPERDKDIVIRLRERQSEIESWWPDPNDVPLTLVGEAADEIERLRADRDRWRSIADSLAEAGTHPTAHHIASEAYDEFVREINETHRG
jgi:hypothetical protein